MLFISPHMLRTLCIGFAATAAGYLGAPVAAPAVASRSAAVSMKVYDWKVRGEEAPAIETLDLSNLAVAPGSHKSKTRKGRGISAGQGATCGFGTRGQKSRSGRGTRPGFEGGQIPLYRRLPKYVGRPMGPGHSKTLYGIVKLGALNSCDEGSTIDYESLQEKRVVSKSKYVHPPSSSELQRGRAPSRVSALPAVEMAFPCPAAPGSAAPPCLRAAAARRLRLPLGCSASEGRGASASRRIYMRMHTRKCAAPFHGFITLLTPGASLLLFRRADSSSRRWLAAAMLSPPRA